jgi:hypothetical protein
LAGGTVSGFGAWIVSGIAHDMPLQVRETLVLSLAAVALGRDFRVVRFGLPESTKMVPQEIFRRGPFASALGFGFALGTGVRTRVPATAPYLLLLAVVVLAPGLITSLLTGLSFGVGRALMTLARYAAADTAAWDVKLREQSGLLVRASAVVATAAATWLVVAT